MRRKIFNFLLILALSFTLLCTPTQKAVAATVTTGDLISLVNGLRTGSYGLPALTLDTTLMAHAQWTAETMAWNGIHDHLANNGYPSVSVRVANDGYGDGSSVGATENWAGGYSSTIGFIQDQWADYDHMRPMVNSIYQHIGAGVATDSAGFTIYIVIAGYVGDGSSSYESPVNSTEGPSSEYMNPVKVATPQANGSVVHTVLYGHTLFTIATAYGVTIDVIKALNDLTDNTIYEGQTLTIKVAPTVTITPTITSTVPRPTRTPTATKSPVTITPTRTLTPTPAPRLFDNLPKIDRQWLGLGILVVSAIGIFLVLVLSFLNPRRKE